MPRAGSLLSFALAGMVLSGGLTAACRRDKSAPRAPISEASTPTSASGDAPASRRSSAGAGRGPEADAEASSRAATEEVFSAPIAAARARGIDLVAGLVASEGVIRAVAFADDKPIFSADVLRGVKWAPDAELHAEPAGDGFAIVWWGLRDGKPSRVLAEIGPQGESRAGGPADVGAAYCGTMDGLAWVGARTAGPTSVRWRRWGETASRDVLSVPRERDPSLVCGDHGVVVLGEGSDDLTASWLAPVDAGLRAPSVVLRDGEFQDDQREHEGFFAGDELGLVRVGVGGGVAIRTVTRDGPRGPWQRLKTPVSEDDEVVAVDGDRAAALVVMTHEVDGACPGSGATPQSVRAIRIDRSSGTDALVDLAPVDCGHGAPGPFWLAQAPAGQVVAWVEHRASGPSKTAPIEGIAYRVVRADGVRAGRITQVADAVADAGCDDGGCSVAALVRAPGSDGMRPGPIRVFAYP